MKKTLIVIAMALMCMSLKPAKLSNRAARVKQPVKPFKMLSAGAEKAYTCGCGG